MVENKKNQRTAAKGRLTRCIKALDALLDEKGDKLNEAALLFDDVLKAWDNTEVKHADYLATLEDMNTYNEEDSWISAEQTRLDKVRRKFMEYKNAVDEQRTIESALQDRTVSEKLFNEQCQCIETSIANSHTMDTI